MNQENTEKKLSDLISVAMGSVSNTGSAIKLIGDMQAKNDVLAYQNATLSLTISRLREDINKIAEEMEREYPREKVIPLKLRSTSSLNGFSIDRSNVIAFSECVSALKKFASTIPAAPSNMEAWYSFLAHLNNLNINSEIKGPSPTNSNGSNPVPGHTRS
jgi:hypothetical protein